MHSNYASERLIMILDTMNKNAVLMICISIISSQFFALNYLNALKVGIAFTPLPMWNH